jgi:hypothetical protein
MLLKAKLFLNVYRVRNRTLTLPGSKYVHTDAIFSGWLATSMTIELSNAYFLA